MIGKRRTAFPRLNQVKSLSPHHRFVIALHSPVKVTETGLRMCRPEKGRQIDAIRSRAVRSLQSALRTKYYELRASLHISRQQAWQFLCGVDLLAEREGFSLPSFRKLRRYLDFNDINLYSCVFQADS